jgi:hypothetical protein
MDMKFTLQRFSLPALAGILSLYGGHKVKRTIVSMPLLAAIAAFQLAVTSAPAQQGGGTAVTTTEELKGTVVQVEGNDLLVKMSTGDLRTFRVPESRRFIIDGKELTVHDLKPGTTLTATVRTTTTSTTVRTKAVHSARVWFVMAPTVILTLPNGENKQYTVSDTSRFMVNGKMGTARDLRKGDVISVERIVEEPSVEIVANIAVVGQAPPPAATASKQPQTTADQTRSTPEEPSTQPEQAPSQARADTPAVMPAPTETTSPLMWVALLAVVIVIIVAVVRTSRKKK